MTELKRTISTGQLMLYGVGSMMGHGHLWLVGKGASIMGCAVSACWTMSEKPAPEKVARRSGLVSPCTRCNSLRSNAVLRLKQEAAYPRRLRLLSMSALRQ